MTGLRAALVAWRDTILFLAGLGFTYHEAVLRTGPERYGLVVLFAGMMGLPMVLRADERSPSPPVVGPPPTPPTPGEVVP